MKAVFAVGAACLLAACEGEGLVKSGGISDRESPHGKGLALKDRPPVRNTAGSPLAAAPAAADVSEWNPAVGDQGPIGSCATWATGYDYGAWLANKAGAANALQFAPMYIYTQVNGGSPDNGSDPGEDFDIMKSQGIDTIEHYDQVMGGSNAATRNYWSRPNRQAQQGAAQHRIDSWETLWEDGGNGFNCGGSSGASAAIQSAISSGYPVVYAFPVYSDFENYSPGDLVEPQGGWPGGGHAVFASKYDAKGIWIQNSWGKDWGDHGWAHLSWRFVEQCTAGVWTAKGTMGWQGGPGPGTLTATITAPAAGAKVSGSVLVSVKTTDGARPVTAVKIEVDGAKAGDAQSSGNGGWSYSLPTPTFNDGDHNLYAVATDGSGASVTSAPVRITIANAAPPPNGQVTARFDGLADGAMVRGAVAVDVSATASSGAIQEIHVSLDGASAVGAAGSPAHFTFDSASVPDGKHTLTAIAKAADGSTGQASITVTADNTAPEARLTSPSAGTELVGAVDLAATATDGNAVAQVDFYANGFLVGTARAAAWQVTWDTSRAADGSYTLVARATDAAGNVKDSAPVTVTVKNGGNGPPGPGGPSVTLTQPVGGATLTGTIPIVASTSDSSPVTSMEVYLDGQLASTKSDRQSYSWWWYTTYSYNGSHTLQVTAHDANGASFSSPLITVEVAN